MKIVLFGNFSVPYCSEVHHAISLEALGHQVIRLQETQITSDQVLSESLSADMLIWIHSHGFQVKGRPMNDVLQILKNNNIPTVAYHLDLYMGLQRWQEYQTHDYFKVQHFFTVDRLMAEWLNEHTQTKGHYIPAGVLHEECYDLRLPKQYDVIFVGSRGYHQEWPYRPQLIDWLRNTYGERFHHFGNDGERVVRGLDLNRLYGQTKVVIGDTLCPNFNYPYYFSDRLFETIGRGGFLIYPYIKGIEDVFIRNSEIITYRYGDFVDLKKKIDHYVEDNEAREHIRQAGFDRVQSDHTYLKRWEQILNTIYGN